MLRNRSPVIYVLWMWLLMDGTWYLFALLSWTGSCLRYPVEPQDLYLE